MENKNRLWCPVNIVVPFSLHVVRTSFLSTPNVPVKSLWIFNGGEDVRATGNTTWAIEITTWAIEITTWAIEITTWATVFTVAQVVKRLFGHVKRAPVEGPSPFLSKDNTLTSEMQIALFSPLPPKASSGEGEFSIGLPEDAAGEEGACVLFGFPLIFWLVNG